MSWWEFLFIRLEQVNSDENVDHHKTQKINSNPIYFFVHHTVKTKFHWHGGKFHELDEDILWNLSPLSNVLFSISSWNLLPCQWNLLLTVWCTGKQMGSLWLFLWALWWPTFLLGFMSRFCLLVLKMLIIITNKLDDNFCIFDNLSLFGIIQGLFNK